MSESLPYLAAPTNIPKALERIRSAPTPPKVTQDFVKTKLQIPSSSGNQMTSYLRRIGFVAPDGSPSPLYIRYRNPKTAGKALCDALRTAYAPLYAHNEYAHDLSDDELRGLIVQVTGSGDDSRGVDLTLKSFKFLKSQATFDGSHEDSAGKEPPSSEATPQTQGAIVPVVTPNSSHDGHGRHRRLGMNLSYTINLNLPPSTDIAVFNAIFKSLKENLLKDIDEH